MDVDIAKVLQTASGVKLPGGIVGKICLVLIVASICIGTLASFSGNRWIIAGGIVAIFLLTFPMLWRVINFADRNPQAALLEGAEFLIHQRILLGSKSNPSIPLETVVITEESREELPPGEEALVYEPDDRAVPTSADSKDEGQS